MNSVRYHLISEMLIERGNHLLEKILFLLIRKHSVFFLFRTIISIS